MRRGRRYGHGRSRTRRRDAGGEWSVRARVERFGEPALLLLLRERPTHGYELLERLPELLPDERVDMGNLYRVLRALEEEGLVSSEWRDDLPGPAKRTYAITDQGLRLLDAWIAGLRGTQQLISDFVNRYEREEVTHVPR